MAADVDDVIFLSRVSSTTVSLGTTTCSLMDSDSLRSVKITPALAVSASQQLVLDAPDSSKATQTLISEFKLRCDLGDLA